MEPATPIYIAILAVIVLLASAIKGINDRREVNNDKQLHKASKRHRRAKRNNAKD